MAIGGGPGGAAPGGGQPPLRLVHTEETLKGHSGFGYWERQSTEAIVASLQPDAENPLIVRADGTVFQGNTRVFILKQRGYDVDSLPRTPYAPLRGGLPIHG